VESFLLGDRVFSLDGVEQSANTVPAKKMGYLQVGYEEAVRWIKGFGV
jgi:hypothetical protein